MNILILALIIIATYALLYVILYVHKPQIYTECPKVKALGSRLVFPMFLMPSGFLNSVIQLVRKVDVKQINATKISKIVEVDEGRILLDIYEPSESFKKSNLNIFPSTQFFLIFCLSKFISKTAVQTTVLLITRIGGKKLQKVVLHLKVAKKGLFKLFGAKYMRLIILDLSKKLNKNTLLKMKKSNDFKNEMGSCDSIIESMCAAPKRENILLIHGLNGTSNSTYIKGMANVFIERGCRVFCFNVRGALIPPTTNMFNHIGMTSDVDHIVNYILANYEGNLSIIGFSMGANWVGKLLGDRKNFDRINMGICVCCPFDFESLKNLVGKNIFRKVLYYGMVLNYKRYLKRSLANPMDFSKCRSIEEVDSKLLNDVYKCDSLKDYYRKSSCVRVLENITIPTLFLSATDDPIIPKNIIPVALASKNPNLSFILTKGGHLGFFNNGEKTLAETLAGQFYDIYTTKNKLVELN